MRRFLPFRWHGRCSPVSPPEAIMKAIKILGLSVMVVAISASAVFAKVDDGKAGAPTSVVQPLPSARALADNVVVTPQGTSGPTPVQPVQPVQEVQPVQPVQ